MRRSEICWKKKWRSFYDPVTRNRLHFFLRILSVGRNPLPKLYTWLLPIFFFRRNFWGPISPNRIYIFFNGLYFFYLTLFLLFFGGTPLYKLRSGPLLFFFSVEFHIQTYGSAELKITKMCSGLLLIQWISLGFLLKKLFSAEFNITTCTPEFYWFTWNLGGKL